MALQDRCLAVVAALLSSRDADDVALAVAALPVHLLDALWNLTKANASSKVLDAVLSNESSCVNLTSFGGDLTDLVHTWHAKRMGSAIMELSLDGVAFKPADLYVIMDALPQLQHLRCAYVSAFSDEHVRLLTTLNLCELCVNWCSGVTDATLSVLATRYTNSLTALEIAGTTVTTQGVLRLVACTKLQRLNLRGAETSKAHKSEHCVVACDQVTDLPQGLDQLIDIDLRGLSCVSTDNLTRVLSPVWPHLERVSLGETALTSSALKEVLCHGCLELLDLSWCFQLDAATIISCIRFASSLVTIKLRCLELSDNCLEAIARHCPTLRKLNIARCRNLSDGGFQAIASSCNRLEVLDASWSLVADATLLLLLDCAPALKRLCLQGCKAITGSFLDKLRETRPPLRLASLDLSWVDAVENEVVQSVLPLYPSLVVTGYYGEVLVASSV
ncbi:hypothetical protein ACHHYP_09331 [Achlya hypogyna]|uniref:Uncharacterized protein n=1 Tax=Achlya hypogyna TaxID=1202772 RepID=A0A1V9YNF1_ACHHY|nr:hypothetical protein ACHHYP_09331 [Achlya hypogyna]